MYTQSQWWSTLKSAVFGSSSSLHPLVGGVDGLMCVSFCKADLLADNFDSKQSRELLICRSFDIRLLVLSLLPSGIVKLSVS